MPNRIFLDYFGYLYRIQKYSKTLKKKAGLRMRVNEF